MHNIVEPLLPLVCDIEKVTPSKRNPRKGDVEAVGRSLHRFGQDKPPRCYDAKMPVCRVCEIKKPDDAFEVEVKMRSGRRTECHECHKKVKRDAYHRRRSEIADRFKERYESDEEFRAARQARSLASYHRNRDRNLAAKRRWRQENPEKSRAYNTRRRARRAGSGYEVYDRLSIFERDGWICQLCLHPVDPTLDWPNPMARTIDHIIPISKHGPDAPANVQLAHLRCNLSKHNGRS